MTGFRLLPAKVGDLPIAIIESNHGDLLPLCLECHDGGTHAPDVLGDNTGTNIREAGALNDTATAGTYETWMGHTLGSMDPAPGGTTYTAGPEGLTCVECHMQHGRGAGTDVAGNAVTNNYRNLAAMNGIGSRDSRWFVLGEK